MTRLPYRQPRLPNLGVLVGRILTAARRYEDSCFSIAEDLHAFHAPSECGQPAFNREYRALEEAIDLAIAESGMTRRELEAEIKARTGGRWWDWTSFSLGFNLKGG